MLREAGAKEVHFRLASPPVRWPCFYGIDMPTREELIASDRSVEEIREYLRVESLGYLSPEGMIDRVRDGGETYRTARLAGDYRAPLLGAPEGVAMSSHC